jgi:hypothetical protein
MKIILIHIDKAKERLYHKSNWPPLVLFVLAMN